MRVSDKKNKQEMRSAKLHTHETRVAVHTTVAFMETPSLCKGALTTQIPTRALVIPTCDHHPLFAPTLLTLEPQIEL